MNTLKSITTVCAFSILISFAACNSADNNLKSENDSTRVADSLKQVKDDFAKKVAEEKHEAKLNLDKMIKDIDIRLDKLNADLKKADAKTQKEYAVQKKNLEISRSHLQDEMNELDKTMDNEWNDFKQALDESVDSVNEWLK